MNDREPGADELRIGKFEGLQGPDLDGAIDEAITEAEAELRGSDDPSYGDIDFALLMEHLAAEAFGGDVRDTDGWRQAALDGDLPGAWNRAVRRQTPDQEALDRAGYLADQYAKAVEDAGLSWSQSLMLIRSTLNDERERRKD